LAALTSGNGLVSETLGAPLALAALLLAVALAPSSRANPFAWNWVHYLGQISYSTYLVHFLLYIAFKLVLVSDPAKVPLALLGLFMLIVLGASVLLHHMVERPAQRVLNRAFDSLRRARPVAVEGA
jgi:peptidoglycan/LPS O-acetylase OafA/YrhL